MPSTNTPAIADRSDTLALLYQGILTGIVRIQAGRQTLSDVETFRRRMKAAFQEVGKEATTAGYDPGEIREAEFAVVAFLDEAILSSREPKVEEWRKRPLNIELFGQAVAGDVFFEKLKRDIEPRRDSVHLADLLEVYLVCLLLGFEGRFAPPLRNELHTIMEQLRRRIESIRGISYRLSPALEFNAAPPAPERMEWVWGVVAALAGVLVVFLLYKIHLSWQVGQIEALIPGVK